MITSRRYDLDWLRIFAFGILIYFHTAIIFIPGGLPMIQNNENSAFLTLFVHVSSQFRLSLLFFISGVGVAFARRKRSEREFIIERSKRLLLPLALGMLLIVPPMVYLEKLHLGTFTGSLPGFYSELLSQGVYPQGNLSWHHFWFIVYLYLFCLLGVRLFSILARDDNRLMNRLNNALEGYWILLPIVPLATIELFLRPLFPGFRDLIHDWASFSHWFIVFLCGYLISNRESILDFACRIRYLSLALAIGSSLFMFHFYGALDFEVPITDPYAVPKYMLFAPLKATMVWCSIITCLGIAGRYFRFSSRSLTYLNEAVYPLFILHLLVIVVLGYWIVQLDWSVWVKFLVISNMTGPVIVLIYHFLIRPYNVMRYLFGVRAKN